jgi:hypothetical protein
MTNQQFPSITLNRLEQTGGLAQCAATSLLSRLSMAKREISRFACRNNLISDSLSRRGVEQVASFRACKAVKAEAVSLDPPELKLRPVDFSKPDNLVLIAWQDRRIRLAGQDCSPDDMPSGPIHEQEENPPTRHEGSKIF